MFGALVVRELRSHMLTYRFTLSACLLFTLIVGINAAELGEFEVEIIAAGEGVQYIVRNANEALLVVVSDISTLSFEANMGIIRVDHSDDDPGRYILHLHPGTSIVTFKSPDHISAKRRFYIDKKGCKSVRIQRPSGKPKPCFSRWISSLGR